MTTIIYHSADFDGIFCREIAKRFIKDPEIAVFGWNFGDALITPPNEGDIYILDLSPDCLEQGVQQERIIWIDHHKTSIEKWPTTLRGYRIDGVAACRLAWQWFQYHSGITNMQKLPVKADFIERKVSEPKAVRLAGEYDVWDKRDSDAETFQYGLRTDSDPDVVIARLLDRVPESTSSVTVENILAMGYIAQLYARNADAATCKARTWLMQWEGLTFLCVNSARFNSLFFAAMDEPTTGHDALMGFCYDGSSRRWTVSLYHAKHRTDLDLSQIAKRYGGGGHRGACGFTCTQLPFYL
jgi:uncharacterized protein